MVKKDYYLILRVKKLEVKVQNELSDEIDAALDYDDLRSYFNHKNLVVIPSKAELPKVLEIMKKYKVGGVIRPYRK